MSWETKKACGPNWKRTGGHRGTTDTHGTWMPPGGPPLNFELGLLLYSWWIVVDCTRRGDWSRAVGSIKKGRSIFMSFGKDPD